MRKIGGISDVMIEIEEMLARDTMSVSEIANFLNVPVSWVYSAADMAGYYYPGQEIFEGEPV